MIALDFDGVLIEHPTNITFEEALTYSPPKDAVKTLNYLVDEGLEFYVLTARPKSEHKLIRKWLKQRGYPRMDVTNVKRPAQLYIDDRCFRFTSWLDISKLLK
jgi:ribonucleotide monophosphatase NagD (HAD superfamily)